MSGPPKIYYKSELYDLTFKERLRKYFQNLRHSLSVLRYEVFSFPDKQSSRFVRCDELEATWTMTTVSSPMRFMYDCVDEVYYPTNSPEGNLTYPKDNQQAQCSAPRELPQI